mgnify:CR=1 FL=1
MVDFMGDSVSSPYLLRASTSVGALKEIDVLFTTKEEIQDAERNRIFLPEK